MSAWAIAALSFLPHAASPSMHLQHWWEPLFLYRWHWALAGDEYVVWLQLHKVPCCNPKRLSRPN